MITSLFGLDILYNQISVRIQRCRDQIKSWIANNVIKDKSTLITQRRLIEKRMEQFKECEKEVKTKAYSKEGLAKAEVIDSEDEEKRDTLEWVQVIQT